jgi:hypothetical protein
MPDRSDKRTRDNTMTGDAGAFMTSGIAAREPHLRVAAVVTSGTSAPWRVG